MANCESYIADVAAPLLDLLRRHARGRVEHGHAVRLALAVVDQGELHGLPESEVDRAVVLRGGGDQVGDHHHRHVLGDDEAVDALAGGLGAGEGPPGHGDGRRRRPARSGSCRRAGWRGRPRAATTSIFVATLTFVDSSLTTVSTLRSPFVSVRPENARRARPSFSVTSRRNVGGASSASSAGGSGVTVTTMSAPGSTVVISTAGPSVRSPAGRASVPGLLGRLGVRDAHDVGERAAVVEVAVHRVRQHRARREAAVELLELGPVRDQPRLLRRAGRRDRPSDPWLGEADERGDRGRAGGQRGGARRHFLHVDARGQVRGRHDGLPLCCDGVAAATRAAEPASSNSLVQLPAVRGADHLRAVGTYHSSRRAPITRPRSRRGRVSRRSSSWRRG